MASCARGRRFARPPCTCPAMSCGVAGDPRRSCRTSPARRASTCPPSPIAQDVRFYLDALQTGEAVGAGQLLGDLHQDWPAILLDRLLKQARLAHAEHAQGALPHPSRPGCPVRPGRDGPGSLGGTGEVGLPPRRPLSPAPPPLPPLPYGGPGGRYAHPRCAGKAGRRLAAACPEESCDHQRAPDPRPLRPADCRPRPAGADRRAVVYRRPRAHGPYRAPPRGGWSTE